MYTRIKAPFRGAPPFLIQTSRATQFKQYGNKELSSPGPKPLVSKPKPKDLGLILKSHGPPPPHPTAPPHHPTYNFQA